MHNGREVKAEGEKERQPGPFYTGSLHFLELLLCKFGAAVSK